MFICQNLIQTILGKRVPRPGINKRLSLGAVFSADVVVYLVVVALRVERRVYVAQVNAFVFDFPAQDFKVVAIVEQPLKFGLIFAVCVCVCVCVCVIYS